MDIVNGELSRHCMALWLRRIVVQDQREMLRQCRVLLENLHQRRNRLTSRKGAVVQNHNH